MRLGRTSKIWGFLGLLRRTSVAQPGNGGAYNNIVTAFESVVHCLQDVDTLKANSADLQTLYGPSGATGGTTITVDNAPMSINDVNQVLSRVNQASVRELRLGMGFDATKPLKPSTVRSLIFLSWRKRSSRGFIARGFEVCQYSGRLRVRREQYRTPMLR